MLLSTVPSLNDVTTLKGAPFSATEIVEIDPQIVLCTMYLAVDQNNIKEGSLLNVTKYNFGQDIKARDIVD